MDILSNFTKDQLKSLRSKLRTGTVFSLGGMIGLSLVGDSFNSPYYDVALASYLAFLFSSKYITNNLSVIPSCEEEIELNKIYKEILNDIINLSKSLDNKTVIEHYELLNELINDYYLCYNLKKGESYKLKSDHPIKSALTLNSHGVCRHYSSMEKDYFQKLGFKSYVLAGTGSRSFTEAELKFLNAFVEAGYLDKSFLDDFSENVSPKELNFLKHFSNLAREKGIAPNHAICQVNDKSYSYFLDIAKDDVYFNNNDILVGLDFNKFLIDRSFTRVMNNHFYKGHEIKILDSKPSFELNMELIKASIKIQENKDMLMNLHNENKDKLERAEEVYQKIITRR